MQPNDSMACKACNDKGFVRYGSNRMTICDECYNFVDAAQPQTYEAFMSLEDVSILAEERSAERHYEATAYRGEY